MEYQDKIQKLKNTLKSVNSLEELKELEQEYLGKKGLIRTLFKTIKGLPENKRKSQGLLIQEIKSRVEKFFSEKEAELKENQSAKFIKNQKESLDFNIPKIGHLHPITQTIRMMNKFFIEMGYSIMEGPEIETDEYCFQRLNVPPNHPARDMQDTLYIKEPGYLLRTHTSSIEARVLESHKPPLKIVCPGRVYRNEKANRSNHFVFNHYQGVVVLAKVSLKDLFGTLSLLFKKMYTPDIVVRYRNKYYPEVEPGVGFDIQCFNCKGRGCPICKNVGWIEMGGAGIIHPDVLLRAGIDKKKWMGFAFGLGLDRWVMAKYKIKDIRSLLGGTLGYKYYENENTL